MAISRNTKTGGGTSLNQGQIANVDDVNIDMDTLFNKINTGLLNADIAAGAAIAYSKLNLLSSIVNADVSASAAIAYSKLNLATSILNADVNAAAAIVYSKLSLASSLLFSDVSYLPYPLDSGIVNGFFDWWQRNPTATGVTVTNGADTYLADRWAVEPAGANCTVSRATTGLHTGSIGDVGIELTGAASMTSIELTQRVPMATCKRLGALLANQNVTFGAKIRHSGTAGTITPTLLVRSTSNTGDDTTATKFANANMTTRVTQAFTGITTTQESSLTHTFDLGAMTDGQNGIEVILSFAAMSAATHEITVSDIYLIRGATAPVTLVRPNVTDEEQQCLKFYQKSFDYGTVPAQNWVGAGSGGIANSVTIAGSGASGAFNFAGAQWYMNPPLRGTPTVTTYNPRAANANAIQMDGAGEVALTTSAGAKSTNFNCDPQGLGNSDQYLSVGAQADAEWYD